MVSMPNIPPANCSVLDDCFKEVMCIEWHRPNLCHDAVCDACIGACRSTRITPNMNMTSCVVDRCYEIAACTCSHMSMHNNDGCFKTAYHRCVGAYLACFKDPQRYMYTARSYYNKCINTLTDTLKCNNTSDDLSCCVELFTQVCFESVGSMKACLEAPFISLCRNSSTPKSCNRSISGIISGALEKLCQSEVESCVSYVRTCVIGLQYANLNLCTYKEACNLNA